MTALKPTDRPRRIFYSAAILIALTCIAIVRSRAFASNPDVLAWAVTFDMTITIPLLYYLAVIRSGLARPISIVPVFVVCATIAAFILPRGYQTTLHDLRFIIAPFELIAIILVLRRIKSAGDNAVTGFVASEVAFLSYAIVGWNKKPDVPVGARSFTVHERSGWGSVAACIVVLIVAEGIGVHLFLQMWSPTAAWIMTALDVYGILWVIGDYNALRLRPSWIEGNVLHLRYGLRWSMDVARENIVAFRAPKGEEDWKQRGVLKMAMIDDPRYIIELSEPVIARGIAGLRRTIRAIAISPDQDEVLTRWISDAQSAVSTAEPARAERR